MTTLTTPVPLSDDHPHELLTRSITPATSKDPLPVEEAYEIERTKRLLIDGGFKTVALQFPDDLLHDAAEVSKRLQSIDGIKTYILADTSYARYPLRGDNLRVVAALMKWRLNISMLMWLYIMDEHVFLRLTFV